MAEPQTRLCLEPTELPPNGLTDDAVIRCAVKRGAGLIPTAVGGTLEADPVTASDLGFREADRLSIGSSDIPPMGVLGFQTALSPHIPIRGRIGFCFELDDWSLSSDPELYSYSDLPPEFRQLIDEGRRSAEKWLSPTGANEAPLPDEKSSRSP